MSHLKKITNQMFVFSINIILFLYYTVKFFVDKSTNLCYNISIKTKKQLKERRSFMSYQDNNNINNSTISYDDYLLLKKEIKARRIKKIKKFFNSLIAHILFLSCPETFIKNKKEKRFINSFISKGLQVLGIFTQIFAFMFIANCFAENADFGWIFENIFSFVCAFTSGFCLRIIGVKSKEENDIYKTIVKILACALVLFFIYFFR